MAGRERLLDARGRAPRQRALLAWLAERGSATVTEAGAFKRSHFKDLEERGLIRAETVPSEPAPFALTPSEVTLTDAQTQVVGAIDDSHGRFEAHLLHGVTGSGKTEVYLRVIASALARGGQVLVLVPEIALTPQLVERFRRRFSAGVVVMHSALKPSTRRDAWRAAHSGHARIIIGTRSAVFTSLRDLALIVVDEEHDASYKQHEGFRYSARDLAVWRAQRAQVPIVLGSATPSLETLENVSQGRYSRLSLPHRVGTAQVPRMVLIDLRKHASEQGLSQPAMQAIAAHLKDGGQVIVFLNRRGYAPCLFCNTCGWIAPCMRCDARMTLHRRAAQLRCHHCGAQAKVPSICADCGQALNPVGQGTERVEETLARLFPDAPLARLDRDTAGSHGAMEAVLERVRVGEARILIGTQMLTKGHDFPDVSLVVILDADQGLFASDFRATERLAQTITQVAGRAGRAARSGEVLIQTSYPEHPLLTRLIEDGYEGFAAIALDERRAAQLAALLAARAVARRGEGQRRFGSLPARGSRRGPHRRGWRGQRFGAGYRLDGSAGGSLSRAPADRDRGTCPIAALSRAMAAAGGFPADAGRPALVDRRGSAGSRLNICGRGHRARAASARRGKLPTLWPLKIHGSALKTLIDTLLRQALADVAGIAGARCQRDIGFEVERTRDAQHGDFASNIAMRLAKATRQNPRRLAEAIESALPANPALAKVEIAGAGFINFFLNEDSYHAELERVLVQGADYGKSEVGRGRSVLVEFVSANPTGPLHVGHGRHAAFGASLANLLEAAGFRVAREYYINDAGRQMEILAASTWLRYLERCGERFTFPANGYRGGYIVAIADQLHAAHGNAFVRSAA